MSSRTQVKNINVDGVSLFYRECGSPARPTLLLIHTFPSSSFQFRELIPLLAAKYRILAPDIPGHGFTAVPPERQYPHTFDTFAATLMAFLDALGVERYILYGAGTGSAIGMR